MNSPPPQNGWNAGKIVGLIAMVVLIIPVGLLGLCGAIIGAGDFAVLGLGGALALCVAIVWLIVSSNKPKP